MVPKAGTVSVYNGRRVLVTGGSGLIGSHLIEQLLAHGAQVRAVVHTHPLGEFSDRVQTVKADLTRLDDCVEAIGDVKHVFHLAAFVGGVGRNKAHPAGMYTPNMLMQTNMLEAARLRDAEQYMYTSSVCLYPAHISLLSEDKAWEGPPEATNASYGWVKRMGELQCQAYAEEYGLNIAIVRPTNAYGPRDNFDLENSHVIPALVRKAVEKQDPYVVWGTGEVSRDFIHARDISRGMMLALEKHPLADPLNLGTGREIKIKDLAYLILTLSGHEKAKVILDRTQPSGQLGRRVDTRKAKDKIGFEAEITLEEGLKETVDWYRKKTG
jgi:GDP-L-fucose synthase